MRGQNVDIKITADPQREKEILATIDPFIKDWIAVLKEALSGVKIAIEVKITGLYNASPAKPLPDAPTPKEF